MPGWFLNSISVLGQQQTALQQMDPATRARVLAALAGLVILGFGAVLLTWLGARVTRRYMNQGVRLGPPVTPVKRDDWASKPLDGE